MTDPRLSVPSMLLVLVATGLQGQPIPNWLAPPAWTPAKGMVATALGDVTAPVPFVGVTPCRVADTRGNGYTGEYGPPSIASGASRTFTIVGQCGIPSGAVAVSFNFTIANITTSGDIRVFPAGGTLPVVSTQNWTASTGVIANAAVAPLGSGGAVTVHVDGLGAIDLIIDVNGYYAGAINSNEYFGILGSYASGAVIYGENSYTGGLAYGGDFRAMSAANGSAGVHGQNNATPSGTDVVSGVSGETTNTGNGAAGVRGRAGSALTPAAGYANAGVRGESTTGFGVWGGTVSGYGAAGYRFTAASGGTVQSAGFLGWNSTDGVHANGNVTASGTKQFVEPHATDPSKVIKYISLEGPEAGTYFRGTGDFHGGVATIEVPEDFRMVTDAEGLTVQVTPVGEFANVAVTSIGLDCITLKASRDVRFFYMVNGVRRAYRDHKPIQEDTAYYVPLSADATMPVWLSEEVKQRLMANGTYNADGTVNMETARRIGWDRAWEAHTQQAIQQP